MNAEVPEVLTGSRRWWAEQGDVLSWLATLPEKSVDLVMGSPPYEKQRTYGIDFNLKGEAWVAWMVEVFKACLRVCKGLVVMVAEGETKKFRWSAVPALLIADLHRAGIHLRKPVCYQRNGIAGSGGSDWWSNCWEFCICATNGGRLPWSDNTAVGRPPKYGPGGEMSHRVKDGARINQRRATRGRRNGDTINGNSYTPPKIANPGNVIRLSVGGGKIGSRLAHETEAPYPEKLVEPFVLCFCPPDGIVLDPFLGSGTTLAVAVAQGRRGLGCDLRQSQVDLTKRRLEGVTPTLFASV